MGKLAGILKAVALLGASLGPVFVHGEKGTSILSVILEGLQIGGAVLTPHTRFLQSHQNHLKLLQSAMAFGAEKGPDHFNTPEGQKELEAKVSSLAAGA